MGRTLSHELSHWVPRQIEIISAGNNFDLYCDGIPSLYTIPLGYNSTVTDHAIPSARAPLCCQFPHDVSCSDLPSWTDWPGGPIGPWGRLSSDHRRRRADRHLGFISNRGRRKAIKNSKWKRSGSNPATGSEQGAPGYWRSWSRRRRCQRLGVRVGLTDRLGRTAGLLRSARRAGGRTGSP